MKEITFEDRVYKKLVTMLPRVEYELSGFVRPESMERFIASVKEFIRCDYGRAWNFYIEFNDTYTSIKKKEY